MNPLNYLGMVGKRDVIKVIDFYETYTAYIIAIALIVVAVFMIASMLNTKR